MASLTVSDLMSGDVIAIPPTATLHEAIAIMVRRSVRHLPVVENGDVVGLLSDRNIRVIMIGDDDYSRRREFLANTTAGERASHPVATVAPDAPVQQAARIFVESRIGCLPVVDREGSLVGILTQTDLLKWFARLTD